MLSFPLLTLAIGAALAGAVAATRRAAIAAALVASAASFETLREVVAAGNARLAEPWMALPGGSLFAADALNAVPITLFSLLTLGVLIFAPRRSETPAQMRSILVILASSLAAYGAENLLVLLAAWTANILPFLLGWLRRGDFDKESPTLIWPKIILTASIVALAIAAVLTGAAGSFSMTALRGTSDHGGQWAFGFLLLAAFLRKGLFPTHSWVVTAFERSALLPTTLFINSHLGAFLIARVVIPLFPDLSHEHFPLFTDAALFTASYASILALAERRPRRLLALLMVSQASFILAGFETLRVEGITGALVHWFVVQMATTGLICAYRAIEIRVGENIGDGGFLGLGSQFPRLATFFLICGLALVGLPGTLGFAAEELLYEGALASHPRLGIALLIATAFNAFHIFRLFGRLFLGRRAMEFTGVADALPRERWVLSALVIALIAGGLMPGLVVSLSSPAEHAVLATSPAVEETAHR